MKSVLFAMRSSMTRGIRRNFSSMHFDNTTCPLPECDNPVEDNQPHLFTCSSLKPFLSQQEIMKLSLIEYEDIFGSLEKQREAAHMFTRLLDIRDEILQEDSLPVGSLTGPRISTIL